LLFCFYTFLAIGFSSGSLEYLKDKMEDPFVRSISAPIPAANRNAIRVIDQYNTDSLQIKYRYDSIVGYNKWTAYFKGDLPESPNRGVDGRSIPYDDPLVTTIVDENINNAIGQPFVNEADISIIITRNLATKLECSEDPAFIYRKMRDGRLVPIPVRAIVDKLPGERVDFMTTQHFYNNSSSLGDQFLFKDNKKLYAYVVIDSVQAEEFRTVCETFFSRYWEEGGMLEVNTIDVYKHQYSHKPLYYLQVSFNYSEDILMEQIDELYTQFRESDEVKAFIEKEKIKENEFIQAYSKIRKNEVQEDGLYSC
jgi:hypothetical protein